MKKVENRFAQRYVYETPLGKILGHDGIDRLLAHREQEKRFSFASQRPTRVGCPMDNCLILVAADENVLRQHLRGVHRTSWTPTEVRDYLERTVRRT